MTYEEWLEEEKRNAKNEVGGENVIYYNGLLKPLFIYERKIYGRKSNSKRIRRF